MQCGMRMVTGKSSELLWVKSCEAPGQKCISEVWHLLWWRERRLLWRPAPCDCSVGRDPASLAADAVFRENHGGSDSAASAAAVTFSSAAAVAASVACSVAAAAG